MPFPFIPNMGIGAGHAQFNPVQIGGGQPSDGRTYYNGTLGTDDAYSEAGSRNNAPASQGPQLGPSGFDSADGIARGVIPYGGYSQLGGRLNGQYSGYYSPDPTAPVPGTQMPGEGPVPNYYGGNAAPHVPEPSQSPGKAAPHVSDPGKMSWAGGIGTSDNSAWGNALGPTYEKSVGGGPLQTSAYQPQGHTNQALPMGYGSVFGLGGGSGR